LHLGIVRIETGDHTQAPADPFYVGFPSQFQLAAESLDLLKSFEVFRVHDAILH
jgi:hypothetical protein